MTEKSLFLSSRSGYSEQCATRVIKRSFKTHLNKDLRREAANLPAR